jgi:hypothetical protein
LAAHRSADGDALAVLLDGHLLEAVEIAQRVGLFDDEVAVGTEIDHDRCQLLGQREAIR